MSFQRVVGVRANMTLSLHLVHLWPSCGSTSVLNRVAFAVCTVTGVASVSAGAWGRPFCMDGQPKPAWLRRNYWYACAPTYFKALRCCYQHLKPLHVL